MTMMMMTMMIPTRKHNTSTMFSKRVLWKEKEYHDRPVIDMRLILSSREFIDSHLNLLYLTL